MVASAGLSYIKSQSKHLLQTALGHDDLFHVHCNDEDTNRTLCGLWGFNVTEELEDVTCPDCQIIVLNHYVVVE